MPGLLAASQEQYDNGERDDDVAGMKKEMRSNFVAWEPRIARRSQRRFASLKEVKGKTRKQLMGPLPPIRTRMRALRKTKMMMMDAAERFWECDARATATSR